MNRTPEQRRLMRTSEYRTVLAEVRAFKERAGVWCAYHPDRWRNEPTRAIRGYGASRQRASTECALYVLANRQGGPSVTVQASGPADGSPVQSKVTSADGVLQQPQSSSTSRAK